MPKLKALHCVFVFLLTALPSTVYAISCYQTYKNFDYYYHSASRVFQAVITSVKLENSSLDGHIGNILVNYHLIKNYKGKIKTTGTLVNFKIVNIPRMNIFTGRQYLLFLDYGHRIMGFSGNCEISRMNNNIRKKLLLKLKALGGKTLHHM